MAEQSEINLEQRINRLEAESSASYKELRAKAKLFKWILWGSFVPYYAALIGVSLTVEQTALEYGLSLVGIVLVQALVFIKLRQRINSYDTRALRVFSAPRAAEYAKTLCVASLEGEIRNSAKSETEKMLAKIEKCKTSLETLSVADGQAAAKKVADAWDSYVAELKTTLDQLVKRINRSLENTEEFNDILAETEKILAKTEKFKSSLGTESVAVVEAAAEELTIMKETTVAEVGEFIKKVSSDVDELVRQAEALSTTAQGTDSSNAPTTGLVFGSNNPDLSENEGLGFETGQKLDSDGPDQSQGRGPSA